MKSVNRDEIISQIAQELDIPFKEVEKVVSKQFKFVAQEMAKGDMFTEEFETIRLTYFGVFKVKKGRVKKIKENVRNARNFVEDNNGYLRRK